MSLLELDNVSVGFLDGSIEVSALRDVSMTVAEGDFVGVWGTRRAGKTTLLRVAAGMELPARGAVRFAGQDMTRMSADARARLHRRGGLALVSADWRPRRNIATIEHVALPLLGAGMSFREAKAPAIAALERAGISSCAYVTTQRLGRAERVRVGLACALVHEPRLLIVDEPAVLLSPSQGVELYELLRTLNRDARMALVVASEEVAPIRGAERMMSLDGGRLRAAERLATVLEFPERHTRREPAR